MQTKTANQPQSQLKAKSQIQLRFLLVLGSTAVVIATSTAAALANNGVQTAKTIQLFNTYLEQANKYYTVAAKLTGNSNPTSLQDIIKKQTGDLGLPDPFEVGDQANTQTSTSTWTTGTNPSLKGYNLQKTFQQASSRLLAQWVLGAKGQKQMKQESHQTEQAAADMSDDSDTAQNSNVTQDIMKQIAHQNAQNALIEQSVQAETQQASVQLANANMNLTNINSTLNTQQQQKQEEDNNAALGHMTQAAFEVQLWN